MAILSEGDVVRETYEVERLLGEGSFAEVYRVRHVFLGRQALKVFKLRGASREELERDLAEALLLSKLKHPNIVEVMDANVLKTPGGAYGYFTMTYVAGGTLERYWRSFGQELMPVDQAVEVARQVCRGLAVAHAASPPIVHRDVKPQNVLVGLGGPGLHVRLSDFGLAKQVNPLTLLASAKGTLGFKPPEALENLDSCAADVWAVGTTLYLTLTDIMPFPLLGDRDIGAADRFLRPMRPPSVYNLRVDQGLDSIVCRSLATAAKDRYPDAAAMLKDLESWSPGYAARESSLSRASAFEKRAIRERSPHDLKAEASGAMAEALEIACDPDRLPQAADLLEEAASRRMGREN